MHCHCASGWICEQHPDQPWPHADCDGPGMQCRNPECPWWQGPEPAALSTAAWNEVYATTRDDTDELPFERHRVDHPTTMTSYRVVQPYGPDKARQSTLISTHPSTAAAFAEIDRLAAQMERTGAPSDAVEPLVIDQDDRIVQRAAH